MSHERSLTSFIIGKLFVTSKRHNFINNNTTAAVSTITLFQYNTFNIGSKQSIYENGSSNRLTYIFSELPKNIQNSPIFSRKLGTLLKFT